MCTHCKYNTIKPLILATLNFGVSVKLIILDPVILAFLLPTTLKRYCIQIFAARYFRELVRLAKLAKYAKGHAKKNGFYSICLQIAKARRRQQLVFTKDLDFHRETSSWLLH